MARSFIPRSGFGSSPIVMDRAMTVIRQISRSLSGAVSGQLLKTKQRCKIQTTDRYSGASQQRSVVAQVWRFWTRVIERGCVAV